MYILSLNKQFSHHVCVSQSVWERRASLHACLRGKQSGRAQAVMVDGNLRWLQGFPLPTAHISKIFNQTQIQALPSRDFPDIIEVCHQLTLSQEDHRKWAWPNQVSLKSKSLKQKRLLFALKQQITTCGLSMTRTEGALLELRVPPTKRKWELQTYSHKKPNPANNQ